MWRKEISLLFMFHAVTMKLIDYKLDYKISVFTFLLSMFTFIVKYCFPHY